MVALTSKGQNFDCFRGKTPTAMATERIWLHRTVHFPSAHFGLTSTDCPCPLGPGRSLLLTFKGSSHCSLPTPPEGPLLGTPIAQSLMLRARTFNLVYTLFLLVQLTLWIF